MAFGNRSTETNFQRKAATGASVDDVRFAMADKPKNNAAWYVAGGAVCLLAFSAPMAWSYFSAAKPALPYDAAYLPKEAIPGPRTYKATGHKVGGNMLMGGGLTVEFPLNTTPTGFDGIDSFLHERCLRPLSKRDALESETYRAAVVSLKFADDFLACTMSHQKTRFCDASYRSRLASRLRKLARVKEAQAFARAQAQANPVGGAMVEIYEEIDKEINKYNKDRSQNSGNKIRTGGKLVDYDLQLSALITEFSRVGLLTTSDFGMAGVPSMVKPHLVAQEIRVCES